MSIFQRHRALRWLAPVGVLGVVGLAAGGMITARATTSDSLPDTTTAELVADLQSASVKPFSGTVVAQMSLGLPQLPAVADERGGSSLPALLAGSHTMRVWYGAADKQRVALLGQTSETDLFHSGTDLWEWDSDTHVATHTVLPTHTGTDSGRTKPTTAESLTPQQLATQFLSRVDPTTRVSLGSAHKVADRSAYDLVLTPRDSATRIGSVHIAVDGSTKLALGVLVYARGATSPAVDVAFSDLSFKTPSASYFSFVPPPGATVHNNPQATHPTSDPPASSAGSSPTKRAAPTTSGSGWSSVVEYQSTPAEIKRLVGSAASVLTPVQGVWGTGRLLKSTLFSALVTTDGRVFVGAVDPQALYAAASKR